MTVAPALAVQLFTFREQLVDDAATVIDRIAASGFAGVEIVCATGAPPETYAAAAPWMVRTTELKRMLDAYGLAIVSAHVAFPEGANAEAVLDEQERLGNDTLIVASPSVLPGGANDDLDRLDTLKRMADRFNRAAELVGRRGMRIGYHNHFWEWNASIDGRPAYEVLWDHLAPGIVAEVDIYWAQVAGCDPARVIAGLGARAQLLHLKDGPLVLGEPMTAVGSGQVDVAAAAAAGEHVRWHIIELDDCDADVFAAVEESAAWLVRTGLSAIRS